MHILRAVVGYFDPETAHSIVQLLRRSPETFWSPTAVAQRLGIAVDVASAEMHRLAANGIIVPAGSSSAFRYAARHDSSE